MIMPKGYKTKELIGKVDADDWKQRIKLNNSIIQVIEQNKLQEEVDDIVTHKKM